MAIITQPAQKQSKPKKESKADAPKYISSKDFFALLRKEVDKHYESL